MHVLTGTRNLCAVLWTVKNYYHHQVFFFSLLSLRSVGVQSISCGTDWRTVIGDVSKCILNYYAEVEHHRVGLAVVWGASEVVYLRHKKIESENCSTCANQKFRPFDTSVPFVGRTLPPLLIHHRIFILHFSGHRGQIWAVLIAAAACQRARHQNNVTKDKRRQFHYK